MGLVGVLSLGACKDDSAGDDGGQAPTTGSATEADSGDGSGTDAGNVDPNTPTWYQEIAPTVISKCAGCHSEGGIAPFPLHDYESAAPWAGVLAEAVESGTMPPFAVDDTDECQMNYDWQDDIRLSDEEKLALRAWADAGAPEGDPDTAVDVPIPPSTDLTQIDTTLAMEASMVVGGDQDEFWCFSLDPGLTEDQYLRALQIRPGNDKVVHHVLIYVDEDGASAESAGPDGSFPCSGGSLQGDLIGAWAPGALPTRVPEGAGMLVPAGSRLVMNIHYHPTGGADEIDEGTSLEIDWLEERPPWLAQLALIGNGQGLLPGPNDNGGVEFVIPPDVADHTESMLFTLPSDLPELRLWQIGAHMHYLGVDMIIGTQRSNSPGPEEECLLHAPNYSFEWQRLYSYDVSLEDTPRLAGGDQLYMRCTYDNTLNNPGVVEALGQTGLEAPIEVRLGEETLDEMCLGVYGIAFPNIF